MCQSDYDHVAIVLRESHPSGHSNSDDIFLFESMHGKGVHITSWNDFLRKNWQDLYEE